MPSNLPWPMLCENFSAKLVGRMAIWEICLAHFVYVATIAVSYRNTAAETNDTPPQIRCCVMPDLHAFLVRPTLQPLLLVC